MTPPPEHGSFTIGERRETERRRMSEPVSVKLLLTVVSGLLLSFILWLSATGAGAVTSSTRFERDSVRRDNSEAMIRRDIGDVYEATMRNDSTSRCILARIERRPSPFCP